MEPTTETGRTLRSRVSDAVWESRVLAARERAAKYEELQDDTVMSGPMRARVRTLAPSWTWSQYLHIHRRVEAGEGPLWERLLDLRVPPPPPPIDEEVRLMAEALRRVDRSIGLAAVRDRLMRDFGRRGDVSESTLKRAFKRAGLQHIAPASSTVTPAAQPVEVARYNGGGGLALLAAAEAETGIFEALAVQVGETLAALESEAPAPHEAARGPRDERGRFAPGYNEHYRAGVEPGSPDSRWDSDTAKRQRRDVSALQIGDFRSATIADRLLAIGTIPLLTETRGFDGLLSVTGGWLGLYGMHPYRPATLDKTLAELALADVGAGLWDTYARAWFAMSRPWSEDGAAWLQLVAYVDSTQDPYWTARFAKSGRVSRTGRVQPCLSRVTVTSGPGVPIVVETLAGTASLKTRLLSLLDELDEVLGPGELGRITVIDAEMAVAPILDALALHDGRGFVTVLKGATLKGATITERGDWQAYRDQDRLREVDVVLSRSSLAEHEMTLRGVQMERVGSRNPITTTFVTDLPADALATTEVVDAYLSRWPHQEAVFRNARNGGGLDRSHGFGGDEVANVTLSTKQGAANRALAKAAAEVEALDQTLASPDLPAAARAPLRRARRAAAKRVQKVTKDLARYDTYPETIYSRDTTRDSIVTVLTLSVLNLVEYVQREYAPELRLQYRSFIEQLMSLPVTVETTPQTVRYRIDRNPRNPALVDVLEKACARVTDRRITRDGRLLILEMRDPPPPT